MKTIIRKYQWTIILLIILFALYLIKASIGVTAVEITIDNFKTILLLVPPILLLVSLMDVWVSKDVIIKYMGKDSGWRGLLSAFLLGSVAVGPLYIAFPIAAMLAKKGARLVYILFFQLMDHALGHLHMLVFPFLCLRLQH